MPYCNTCIIIYLYLYTGYIWYYIWVIWYNWSIWCFICFIHQLWTLLKLKEEKICVIGHFYDKLETRKKCWLPSVWFFFIDVLSLRSRIWLCFPPVTITTIIPKITTIINPTQILKLCALFTFFSRNWPQVTHY